ncbi:hypothetical protein ACMFMG_008176 [Clarireedia jacksonii]
MSAVINSDIAINPTKIQIINRLEASSQVATSSAAINSAPSDQIRILQYDTSFSRLIGDSPTHSLLFSTVSSTKNPFFHEACVFLPEHDELYITSNLLQANSSSNLPTILISRIKLTRSPTSNDIQSASWVKMRPPHGIDMPNGGVNHDSGILFCAQGNLSPNSGGIYHMPRSSPPRALVTNFHGRPFNSPNDVVVSKDGSIWFTDPCYGYEQDFRPPPKLPCHVYRFDTATGDIRVMADGLVKPNGIAFAPGEETLYVTDTGMISGDGGKDLSRPATIYAFTISPHKSGAPSLINKRVFAFAAQGIPDGIKCDIYGNVYAGCGDGVEVWDETGTMLGRILVPGGVANFCFGKEGEIFVCAEQRLWRVQLGKGTKGALLGV